MGKIYSVTIKFTDDGEECDVLMYEFHDSENLPDGYTDMDIFFYGMGEKAILDCMSNPDNKDEWHIIAYHGEVN